MKFSFLQLKKKSYIAWASFHNDNCWGLYPVKTPHIKPPNMATGRKFSKHFVFDVTAAGTVPMECLITANSEILV